MKYKFVIIFFILFLSQRLVAQVSVTATAGTLGPTVYTNLRLAFAEINNGTHQGVITITITSSPAADAMTALLTASGVTGALYTAVNIVPSASGLIITSSANPAINFNGADNVTIDGGNGGSFTGTNRLTFRQTTNNVTCQFINDATNYTIGNAIFESNSTSTNGTFFFSTGTTTGNDNITVQNCVIRNRTDSAPTIASPGGTTNLPRAAINSTGSSLALQNDNITFDACEFINFFSGSNNTVNILIGNNTKTFTLKNSHVYQTVSFFGNSMNSTYSQLVQVNGTNTDNILIDGNFFGGNAINCGGSAFIFSNPNGNRCRMRVVHSTMTTGTTLTIQNNTVSNFQTDFQGTNTGGTDTWQAFNGSGKMIIKNNIISKLRFSQTTNGGTPASANVQIINYAGDGAGEITNNKLEDIQFSFTMTPTNGFSFDAIRIDPANSGLVVSQNTIGSTSVANSILCNAHASVNAMRGINVVSATNDRLCNINNNTIANMTHNGTSSNISSELVGIKSTTISNINVIENNINNLTSVLQIASTQTVVSVAGINLISNSNYEISKNTIHSISCRAVAGTGANACGILLDGGISGKVQKNTIYNIRNTSGGTTPAAAGIISRNIGSMLIYNNMISLGLNTDGTANTEDAIYIGLWNNLSDGDNLTFVYNSVAISGSINGGTKNSYGLLRGDNAGTAITTPVQVINNLFHNERQELGAGTGKHFALGNQATCAGWGGGVACGGVVPPCIPTAGGTFLPNYNALYSANTATIGEWLGASQDFANWKTVTLADDKSTSLASTITFTDAKAGNLHIPNTEFRLNAVALPLPTITSADYDGDFRRGPDIGADEVENTITFAGASDDWNDPTNWTPSIVPTCADIAIVPTGKSIKIYGGTTAQCYRLVVQSGGTLTLQNSTAILEQCWLKGTALAVAHDGYVDIQASGTLTMNDGTLRVAGNFLHSGSFDKGTSTTELNLDRPTGNICITNHINSYNSTVSTSDIGGSVNTNFHNLTILNSGNTTILGTKNVTVGDAITKEGILDITDGSTLVINGNKLTIEGTLAERTGTITGSTTSKLHILGKGDLVGTLKFISASIEDFQEVVMNRINDGSVKGLAILGNASLQIADFLDLTAGILKTGTIASCGSGGAASLEISVTNPDLTNSIRNFNPAGYVNTGGWVWGNLRRAITGTGLYRFPLGDGSRYELFDINITNALTGTNNILGYFNQCDAPINGGWTVTDIRGVVHFVYSNICVGGYWRMSPDAFAGGRYDAEVFPVSIPCAYPDQTIGKSVEGAGVYGFGGSTHASGTKRTGYTSFSDFALITASVVLPVNLLSFNAFAQKNNSALISWETVWERENDYFEVQKSIDGKNFFTIGRLSGKGTSSTKNSYQFTDNEPHKGVNYYRLKQLDLDGKINLSKVISLYFESNEEVFEIFPNPTSSLDINIILSAQAGNLLNISLIDALGRNISAENYTYKGQFIQLKSNEKLTKGIYFVVVHNISTGKTNTRKLIIE